MCVLYLVLDGLGVAVHVLFRYTRTNEIDMNELTQEALVSLFCVVGELFGRRSFEEQ